MVDGQRSDPLFAAISASSLGDNELVAAVATKRIRVIAIALVASGGANTIRFESDAGGTALSGQMDIADNGQFILPKNGFGWFETVAGESLNLELSAATLVAGVLVYEEVL